MKTKVYLQLLPNASGKLQVCVSPVVSEDGPEQDVLQKVLNLLENKMGATRTEVLEGLDQTYIDYLCKGVEMTLLLDPWSFISLTIPDEKLRNEIFEEIAGLFEVVPRPPQDGDDE